MTVLDELLSKYENVTFCFFYLIAHLKVIFQELAEMSGFFEHHEMNLDWKTYLVKEDLEMIFLRFLVEKSGSVDETFKAFELSMQWRIEQGLEDVLDYDDPRFEEYLPFGMKIKKYVPHLFYGETRDGLPLVWELKGRIDASGLSKEVTVEEYCARQAHTLVSMNRFANKKSREHHRFLGFCAVFCCKAISATHRKCLPYFKYDSEWAQRHFPELIAETLIFNTPWWFNMIWKMIRPRLDEKTASRVRIITEEQLQDYIEHACIPEIFGGNNPRSVFLANP
jgi:hypothetical protein